MERQAGEKFEKTSEQGTPAHMPEMLCRTYRDREQGEKVVSKAFGWSSPKNIYF